MIALVAAASFTTSAPHALPGCSTHPQTRAGVLATERDWVRALEERDVRALSCILAPEFVDTSWRGELVSRAEVLRALPSRPPSRLALSGLSVFEDGRFAIVRGTNSQSSPASAGSVSVQFTDMFVYRAGAWRAVSAQETPIAKR